MVPVKRSPATTSPVESRVSDATSASGIVVGSKPSTAESPQAGRTNSTNARADANHLAVNDRRDGSASIGSMYRLG